MPWIRNESPTRPSPKSNAVLGSGITEVTVAVTPKNRPYLAASDYMAQKIAGARKTVIPEAGHAVNLHQPDRFDRELLDFLEAMGA